MSPRVPVTMPADPAEPALSLWLSAAGAVAAVFAAVWSAIQRWNFAMRIEAMEGKLRFSFTVAERSEPH